MGDGPASSTDAGCPAQHHSPHDGALVGSKVHLTQPRKEPLIAHGYQPFSPVIQSIAHTEQPAEIDEREAAEFVALQHAGFVERNLGRTSSDDQVDCESKEDHDAGSQSPEEEDRVILGKLNRMSKELRAELSDGASLRSCRDALEAAGHPWKLLSGTLVFVHPWQYRAVISALSCDELRPHQVVFAESLAYLLEETLARYKGSWLTACAPVKESIASASQVGTASEAGSIQDVQSSVFHGMKAGHESAEDEDKLVMCVQRTFVCIVHRLGSLERHVTASSTDAHCPGFAKPRIVASERERLWQC
jgi:hypothetical protein